MITDILTRIGAGMLGLIIYFLLTIYGSGEFRKFSFSTYFSENKNRGLISILLLVTIAVTITVIPGTGVAVKSGTGLAVSEALASFWTLGYGLGSGTRKIVSKNVISDKSIDQVN